MLKAWPSVRHNKTNKGYSKKKARVHLFHVSDYLPSSYLNT